jgi:hypothetical protein
MGHVEPQYYRPAPGNASGPVNAGQGHPLVPPQTRSAAGSTIGTPSPGLLALTIGGGVLAFLSLFLVVPFLLANTGTGGVAGCLCH